MVAAGLSTIRVAVHRDTDADADADTDAATVAELHRKVAATSPVGHSLQTATPLEFAST